METQTLRQQIQAIDDQAMEIIKAAADKAKGVLTIAKEFDLFDQETDGFIENFGSISPMIEDQKDLGCWTNFLVLKITNSEFGSNIATIDEDGNEYDFDLASLSATNKAIIADFLNLKNA